MLKVVFKHKGGEEERLYVRTMVEACEYADDPDFDRIVDTETGAVYADDGGAQW